MGRLRGALASLQLVKSFAVGRTKANVNTPAPVPQNGSGHLIPAFHGTGRTFSLLPSHPLDAASCSIDASLDLVLERQSSQAKDGFVESKKLSIVFCAELTARGTSEPCVFHQNENPARSASFKRMKLGMLSTFLTERRAVGFLRHLANIFARSHCWTIFLFECHN